MEQPWHYHPLTPLKPNPKPKSDAWLTVLIICLLGILFAVFYLQGVKDGQTSMKLEGYRKVAAEVR